MVMAIIKVAYLVMHVHQNMVTYLEIPMAEEMLDFDGWSDSFDILIMIRHSGMIPIETVMVTS